MSLLHLGEFLSCDSLSSMVSTRHEFKDIVGPAKNNEVIVKDAPTFVLDHDLRYCESLKYQLFISMVEAPISEQQTWTSDFKGGGFEPHFSIVDARCWEIGYESRMVWRWKRNSGNLDARPRSMG